MALTKEVVLDQITADEHGNLMYREVTRIMEDGKELSKSYHRSSLSPGAFCSLAQIRKPTHSWLSASTNKRSLFSKYL